MLRRERRYLFGVILVVWVMLLLWLTIFGRQPDNRQCFFIPFQTTTTMPKFMNWYTVVYLIGGNIFWFIPIGFLTRYVVRIRPWLTIVGAAALSIVIEACQYIFSVGTTDIDDLIYNTLGAVIGVLLFGIAKKRWPHLF